MLLKTLGYCVGFAVAGGALFAGGVSIFGNMVQIAPHDWLMWAFLTGGAFGWLSGAILAHSESTKSEK